MEFTIKKLSNKALEKMALIMQESTGSNSEKDAIEYALERHEQYKIYLDSYVTQSLEFDKLKSQNSYLKKAIEVLKTAVVRK